MGEPSEGPTAFSPEQMETDNPAHNGPVPALRQYSNEARAYHARYAELSEAHDQGRHNFCREGCLDMLNEPNVPYYTRVQILQMLSTLLALASAQSCLQEAASILAKMDNTKFQVQLLTHDNERMQADLESSDNEADNNVGMQATENRHHEFGRALEEQRITQLAARQELEGQAEGLKKVTFGEELHDEGATQTLEGSRVDDSVAVETEARPKQLSPADSMFARLSPVDSVFARLSPGDSMFARLSPGESMLSDEERPKTSGSAGIAGIEAVLAKDKAATARDAAIEDARAKAESGRLELAALEEKLAAIQAQKKTENISVPATTSAQQDKTLPVRTLPTKYPDIGIGQAMGRPQHVTANTQLDVEADSTGIGPGDGDLPASKGFRKLSARAMGVLGLGAFVDEKGDKKRNKMASGK